MFVRTITLTALAGEDSFQTRCALCHGGDGTDRAPSILPTLSALAPDQLRTIISNGVPAKGMPAFEIPDAELGDLIAYLKNLGASVSPAARDPRAPQPRDGTVRLIGGGTLNGTILNMSGFDAHVRTPDGRLHLLRREADAYREVAIEPSQDWSSYNGSDSANRHSGLAQINRDNVERLTVQWFYPIPDMRMIEGTPVVVAGVMYVTAANRVNALDASTGREI